MIVDGTLVDVVEGWVVYLNPKGESLVIPPEGADPADCPSAALDVMLRAEKEWKEKKTG